jgi:hypothetical protein
MRLTRHIEGDAFYRGQEVYDCAVWRIALTLSVGSERCARLSADK